MAIKEEEDLKSGNTGNWGTAVPQSVEETKNFFAREHSTVLEAEKFYNYFQSNGWKVGGRAPMKDWKAAARNWILNSKKFHDDRNPSKPGRPKTGPEKDYSEPL